MSELGLYCVDQNTGNMSCSVISDMHFCTQIVFVIIFSNLMLIIFEDQDKYWHILLNSTLIKKEEGISLRDLANDVVFFWFYFSCNLVVLMHDHKIVVA